MNERPDCVEALYDELLEIERGGCYCPRCRKSITQDDSVLFYYFGVCGNCAVKSANHSPRIDH